MTDGERQQASQPARLEPPPTFISRTCLLFTAAETSILDRRKKCNAARLLPLSSAHCIGAGERLSAAVPSSASAVVLRGAGVVQGQRRRSRSDAAAQPGVHEPRTCAVGVRGGHTWKAVAAGQSVKLSAVTAVPERPAVLHGNARVPSNDRECAKCKVVTEPVSCDLAQDDRWCNGHGGRGNFGQGQRSTLRSLIPRSP